MNPTLGCNFEMRSALQALFPEQCLKSTPDPEFLFNLYGFDMSLCPHGRTRGRTSHISQIFKETFDAINSASMVPELLVWTQSQKHPDQSVNLFNYNQQSIETWLREELFSIQVYYDPSAEILHYFFASAILVDFQQFRDIHHLIPQVLDLYSTEHDYPQIEDSDKWEIYVKYRKIISRFLIDQSRFDFNHPSMPHLNNTPISLYRWSGRIEDKYVRLARYLIIFLSKDIYKMGRYKVDIPKAVLIFLPIVFSHAGRSAAALDLLGAGSFSFDSQLQRRFPQENWDQLFSSSFEACKLAIGAEDDKPMIPEPEIGTENRDQQLSSSYKPCKLSIAAEGDNPTTPEPDVEIGTSSRGRGLCTMLRWLKGLFKPSKS